MDFHRSSKGAQPIVYHITEKGVAFPVWTEGGLGQIVVELEPGQSETVTIHGRLVTVIRDYVH